MSRIFKNSTFKMQLLVADNINTSIDGLSFKFHTTDPNIYVEVFDNYTLKANIATLTIGSTLFGALDEGVLTYEVRGYLNGEYVTIERQSNYFLKYNNSIPQQVNLQEKNVDINDNGLHEIYPDDGFNGMSKVNVNVDIPAQGGSGDTEFDYLEPEQAVDIVLNQGVTGTFVIKGQITEVQSIDLNYGNATYFLGDLKVFRGTGLNNSGIIEEDYFQVGDWVVIVGNISNYNGTAQVDRGSTLVAKWRETPVTENKWGITGYFNNWGGTPDIYFEDPGFQLSFMGEMKDVRVVYGFETDGQEIKIRYNNQWNYSYSAEIYDIPQIRPLIISDMNMDLVEGKYDIYLLGYNGDEKFEPEYILFMPKDEDISLYNLSDYVNVMNPRAPLLLTATNEFNGEVYSTTESKMSFLAQLGCYFALRQELADGTVKEGTMVYDGVTTDYLFNV